MNLAIIGTGGFAREVFHLAKHVNKFNKNIKSFYFVELDKFYKEEFCEGQKVLRFSECDLSNMSFVIAVGDPSIRRKIANSIPTNTKYANLISPLAFVANDLVYEDGLIVMPFSYLSCNVKIGKHVHVNSHCVVGHDSILGDFFTSACGVNIAGNNLIEDNCYFGMNSSTRQGISITKNSIIGLNAGVVKNILTEGTYIGTPAKLISK